MTRDLEHRAKDAEHRARVAELHWEEATANAIQLQSQFDNLVGRIRSAPRRRITTQAGRQVEVFLLPVDRITAGHGTEKRCPRCGSTLLRNALGDEWCSFVGGDGQKACTYGLAEDPQAHGQPQPVTPPSSSSASSRASGSR